MGRVVQQIPLRRCHLGNGIAAEVEQAGCHHAVLGSEGVHQFPGLISHSAISGHDVLLGPQFKYGIGSHNRLARFLVCLSDCNRPHLWGIVQRQAFAHQLHRLPAIGKGYVMGRTVEDIPLRRGDLGNGIGAEIQRLGHDGPLHRRHGVHQLARVIMHHAVAGYNVLLGMDMECSIGQGDRLAGFLVHLSEGDCPHLRGVINGDALRHKLHRLLPIEQGHIVHGGVLHIAMRCRFLGYGVRPQI